MKPSHVAEHPHAHVASGPAVAPAAPLTLDGSSVLHQMFRIRWNAWKALDADTQAQIADEAAAAWSELEGDSEGGSALFSQLGHKGDLMAVHFRRSFDALNAAEIPYSEELVELGDFSMDSGAVAMERLLALENPPTAVFAGNDEMAFGAMAAAHRQGLSVPNDISMVGFDDQKTAEFYIPALTTVNIPRHELGRRAAQELLDRVGGRETAHEIVLPTKLIVRESTAEPRARRKPKAALTVRA